MSKKDSVDDLPEGTPEENFAPNYVASAYGPLWSDQELAEQKVQDAENDKIKGILTLLEMLQGMSLKDVYAFYRSLEHLTSVQMEGFAFDLWKN